MSIASPASARARRVLLARAPFAEDADKSWLEQGLWPAHWIALPDATAPLVAAYRLQWEQSDGASCLIHVSADERYELYLDGELIGRGPERGVAHHWFFESYQLDLAAGPHLLVARVWSQGAGRRAAHIHSAGEPDAHAPDADADAPDAGAPFAQESVAHGFLLCPDEAALAPLLATGQANWQGAKLNGIAWVSPLCTWGTGNNVRIDGREFDWDFEHGNARNWGEIVKTERAGRAGAQLESGGLHGLVPAMLPPMMDELRAGFRVRHVADTPLPTTDIAVRAADCLTPEIEGWQRLLDGRGALQIAANTRRRVIVDLENYFCARPTLTLSGGRDALVRVHWAEGLYRDFDSWDKGNRDEIEGHFFTATWNRRDGVGDQFVGDGGARRRFETLWWQAGRYLEICVETAVAPLTIEAFGLRETRYPLEVASRFRCGDAALTAIAPMMVRALQMCAHETYMDCPYYEQLMYIGDTRLQILAFYVLTRDDALPRKALKMFDLSRLHNGLTQSRYPSRVGQVIPPFSLWWVAMVHDFALWRDDAAFVRELLPGVRAVCDYFAGLIGRDGLLGTPDGWNFVDWVPTWKDGCAPDAQHGVSGVLGWHAALTFRLASELERWHGAPELEELQLRRARDLAAATHRAFWDEARGLYADDLAHQHWSQHAQCLAILSGLLDQGQKQRVGQGLLQTDDLAQTTIYFSHYLFEALRDLEQIEAVRERLQDWEKLLEDGLKTTVEMPEPTRSDCHGWGAHPLFHFFATFAGIRPTAPGFARFGVHPQGDWSWMEATLPHPRGEIAMRWRKGEMNVEAPDGVEFR